MTKRTDSEIDRPTNHHDAIVGAALCGRPSSNCPNNRAATEGRPYNKAAVASYMIDEEGLLPVHSSN